MGPGAWGPPGTILPGQLAPAVGPGFWKAGNPEIAALPRILLLPGSQESPGETGAAAVPVVALGPGTAGTALPAKPRHRHPQSILLAARHGYRPLWLSSH